MDDQPLPKPETQAPKKRKVSEKTVVTVKVETAAGKGKGEGPPSDLWSWRKYGQKPIKGSPYPRGYYRCSTSKGCSAKKQVERCRTDPSVVIITYTSDHNHPDPSAALPPSTSGEDAKDLSGAGEGDPSDLPEQTTAESEQADTQGPPSGAFPERRKSSPEPAGSPQDNDFFDELEELPVISSTRGWVRSGGSFDEKVVLPLPIPLLHDL